MKFSILDLNFITFIKIVKILAPQPNNKKKPINQLISNFFIYNEL